MKTKRMLTTFVALTPVAFVVVIGILWVSNRRQQAKVAARREMETQLANVCNGAGVADASPYDETSGIHPVVYASKTAIGYRVDGSGYYTPVELKSSAPADTELVACIVEERVVMDECPYELENGKRAVLIRQQRQVVATLREAQTGEVVATSETLIGGDARKCGRTETFKGGALENYAVGARPDDALDEWVKPYVQAP